MSEQLLKAAHKVLTALDSEYPRKNMPLGHVRALAEAAIASAPQASQSPQGAVPQTRPLSEVIAEFEASSPENKARMLAARERRDAQTRPGDAFPQGASSLLPEPVPAGVYYNLDADNFYDADGTGMAHAFYKKWQPRCMEFPTSRLAASLASSPLPAPQEPAPAHVHKFRKIGGGRHYEQANLSAYGTGDRRDAPEPEEGYEWYGSYPLYAAPAPVDHESQGAPYTQLMSDSVTVNSESQGSSEPLSSQGAEVGLQGTASTLTREQIANLIDAAVAVDRPISATQPASPARELTDAELTAIGAKHLEAHAQFVGAGEVWVEGEVDFARAVIARDRALREQG